MSRFGKLSQTIWHCQYHIVWVPKYRFRVFLDSEMTRKYVKYKYQEDQEKAAEKPRYQRLM